MPWQPGSSGARDLETGLPLDRDQLLKGTELEEKVASGVITRQEADEIGLEYCLFRRCRRAVLLERIKSWTVQASHQRPHCIGVFGREIVAQPYQVAIRCQNDLGIG